MGGQAQKGNDYFYGGSAELKAAKNTKPWIFIGLFLLTFVTTTMSGVYWKQMDSNIIDNWPYGLAYSLLLMIFISAHEFGHYIASRRWGVSATFPYYIPVPPSIMPFGTFGAVIKTKSRIPSKTALFDIGAAGPISGFIVCVIYLIIGFSTLPEIDYLYTIHPNYMYEGAAAIPDTGLFFGDPLLYIIFEKLFAGSGGFIPPMNEMYHYPLLNVGWFGLFVTALNLIPIGQLDGGHITYAMFGKHHIKIAKNAWRIVFIMGIGGVLGLARQIFAMEESQNEIYQFFRDLLAPALDAIHSVAPWFFEFWAGWLFWALLTRFVIKLKHPSIGRSGEKISPGRMALGWVSIIILILSFSYNGIYFILPSS